jgi:hypothetical protein
MLRAAALVASGSPSMPLHGEGGQCMPPVSDLLYMHIPQRSQSTSEQPLDISLSSCFIGRPFHCSDSHLLDYEGRCWSATISCPDQTICTILSDATSGLTISIHTGCIRIHLAVFCSVPYWFHTDCCYTSLCTDFVKKRHSWSKLKTFGIHTTYPIFT